MKPMQKVFLRLKQMQGLFQKRPALKLWSIHYGGRMEETRTRVDTVLTDLPGEKPTVEAVKQMSPAQKYMTSDLPPVNNE